MIAELFRAAFMAGLPVAFVSYLLVWWAFRSDYFEKTSDLRQLEKQVSGYSKAQKKNKKKKENATELKKLNPVHNKWMKFGGGFYGVVALITFAVVELGEIVGFLGNLREVLRNLSGFSIDFVVRFFIDSLMNFITAIAWPMYWMSQIETNHVWAWFLAAYGGYWFGARAALQRNTDAGGAP